MKKIAVVHYMPLEFYPPVTNFLDILGSKKNLATRVFSTRNNKNRKGYNNESLTKINRSSFPNPKDSGLVRIKKYLEFNFYCLQSLIKFAPSEIIYFESYSAGPVYWYLRFFGKNTKLSIHYHEYSSPHWYENGMRLVRTYHIYEKKYLYKRADWISQTNSDRVNLFLKDLSEVPSQKMHVLPNYPPKHWSIGKKTLNKQCNILKTVYVGSLSLEATYIMEYCEWVIQQKGKVTFDIFSYNLHEDTRLFLNNLNSEFISFKNEGIEYEELPSLLRRYNVGVILYKGLTKNYIYNAPNKLFEYMACGLEIWFSSKMEGCFPYEKADSPRIIAVDFNDLESDLLLSVKESKYSSENEEFEFTADRALEPLIEKLTK